MISSLIDKQDRFEQVRDQIAAILKLETDSQQALATAAGKDPDQWKLNVYSERSNPWDQYQDHEPVDQAPIVNVWVDNMSFDKSKSDRFSRQHTTALFNIDCYGYGVSSADGQGHKAGDEQANLEVQRAVKLVRNIIMAADYMLLEMQGEVSGRWINSISMYQPEQNNNASGKVSAARLTLEVEFNEFAPQMDEATIEYLSTQVCRQNDGKIVLAVDYDYTQEP